MHLRVNADDLGMSARVNDESFDLISHGLVDSASIIANAPETGDAIRRARQFPRCSFGVHLNVTQFKPLRKAAAFAPVLTPGGSFTNVFWRVRRDSLLKRAVYREWAAQIERCLELGLRPAHLDSHHDVHLLPEFAASIWRLQRKFGIRRVRRGTRIPAATRNVRRVVRDRIWTVGCMFSRSELTDYRCDLNELRTVIESGARLAGRAENRSVELLVHPGNDFKPVFREETELLRAGWVEYIKRHGFRANGSAVPGLYSCPEIY